MKWRTRKEWGRERDRGDREKGRGRTGGSDQIRGTERGGDKKQEAQGG